MMGPSQKSLLKIQVSEMKTEISKTLEFEVKEAPESSAGKVDLSGNEDKHECTSFCHKGMPCARMPLAVN